MIQKLGVIHPNAFELFRMTRHLLLSVLLTTSLCGLAAAEQWPTTHFEVVAAKPHDGDGHGADLYWKIYERVTGNIGEPEDGPFPLAHDQQLELENHLHEAALQLEAWGFPPPALEPRKPMINRREGVEQVYHVFLFKDEKKAEGKKWVPDAYYQGACSILSSGTPYLMVNTRNWKQVTATNDAPLIKQLTRLSGKDWDKLFADVTHELFHAVQDGTRVIWNYCKYVNARRIIEGTADAVGFDLGDYYAETLWITEGTADAVGFDLVKMLRGERTLRHSSQIFRWGWKAYSDNLESLNSVILDDEAAEYRSSSFWRYLAELTSLRISSKSSEGSAAKPGPKPGKTDYSYLARFFNQEGVDLDDVEGQIKWLHESLKKDSRIRVGLDRVLPDFYSVFSDYGRHRAKPTEDFRNEDEWRGKSLGAFEKCTELTLAGDQQSANARLFLLPRAGRCFSIARGSDVLVSGIGVTVTITASSKAGALQLALGESGGRRVSHDQLAIA